MNKNLGVGLGVLLVLMGSIFGLQGLGFLKGSQMTGETLWAVIGPLLALGGAALIYRSVRTKT